MEHKQNDISEEQSKDQETSETEHIKQMNTSLIPTKYEENQRITQGKKTAFLKPMIIAVFSAILVGSILGFFMLNMFTNLEGEAESHEQKPTNVHANPVDQVDNELSSASLQGMSAFVLQGGVFSKAENAKEWALKFQQATLPTVIFEKDQQHYLFVGIANTEGEAKKLATTLAEQQFEVYVKEWKTEEIQIELTEEEQHWVKSFQKQWQDTLQSIYTGDDVSLEGWNDLVNSHPLQSEIALQLVDEIHMFYDEDSGKISHIEWQEMLLSTWKMYNEIFS